MSVRCYFASALALSLALAGCSGSGKITPQNGLVTLDTPKSVSPGSIAAPPMARTPILPASAMQSPPSEITTKSAIQNMSYTQIPGSASYAAAAPDGSLWVLSNQPAGPDKFIWHYVNGSWTNISGMAMRISVAPDGTLYAINSAGGAYSYSGGIWTAFGGGCRDLTAAADGTLYVISNGGGADGAIWHYASGAWTQQPGSGNRLAASWDTRTYSNPAGTITPGGFYVINSLGSIYYLGASGYIQLPGGGSAIAPMNGGLFVLGYPSDPNGNALYYYDLDTPGWSAKGGTGVSISTNGSTLYVIGASSAIYASTITPSAQILVDASQIGPSISKDLLGAQSPYYLTDYTQPNDAAAFASLPLNLTTYGDGWYHWQNNTWCQPTPTNGLPANEQINSGNPNGSFDNFMSRFVQPDHLDPMIHVPIGTNPTCNGRADPSEAAAWVDYSNNTKHYGVKYWEIGFYAADQDTGDFGSPPYISNSPSTYVSIANTFAAAMKAKDSTIQTGVMISPVMGGPGPSSWDTTVLAGANADFVIFPEAANSATNPGNPSDSDLLFNAVPFMHGTLVEVKNELAAAGKQSLPVFIDVLTGNEAQNNSQQSDSITTSLYFGMAIGEIMNNGFAELTYGFNSCNTLSSVPGEYGSLNFAANTLVVNGTNCPVASGTIMPQGRAFQLAGQFASAGEHALGTTITSQPNIRGYAATQGSGYSMFLFNLDQNNATTATVGVAHASRTSFTASTLTYGKAQYDAGVGTGPVSGTLGTVGNTFSVTLPPWSMTVVKLQ